MRTTAIGLAAGFPADYQNINQIAPLLYKVVPPYNRVWSLGSLKTVESLDDPTLVAHLDAHGLLVTLLNGIARMNEVSANTVRSSQPTQYYQNVELRMP